MMSQRNAGQIARWGQVLFGRLASILLISCLSLSGCQVSTALNGAGLGLNLPVSEADHNRAKIKTELAASYYQQRNYATALEVAEQAIRIEPGYAPAHGVIALVRFDLAEHALAEQSFKRALAYDARDADLNNNYGWFLCQTDRMQQSLEYFKRALADSLYRTPALALSNAGVCALKLNDRAAAEAYFRRALQFDASHAQSLLSLASLQWKAGEYAAARALVVRFNRLYEPSAESLWLELLTAQRMGDTPAVDAVGAQLKKRFPDSPQVTRLMRAQYDE